jgi:ribosomal protein L37E
LDFEIHINRKRKRKSVSTKKKGRFQLKCAKCGKEILDEESSFCAYCGSPFDSKLKSSDLTTGAGILAIIAATFSIAVGAIGVVNYLAYVDYYAGYGYESAFIGFLFFAVFAFIASIFGFAGGILALTRKRFKFSVLGMLVMYASALFTLIAVWYYQYNFSEGILLSAISIAAFSIVSAVFVVKSKTEFT